MPSKDHGVTGSTASSLRITAERIPRKCACTWVHYRDDPWWVLHEENIHTGCFIHGKKE